MTSSVNCRQLIRSIMNYHLLLLFLTCRRLQTKQKNTPASVWPAFGCSKTSVWEIILSVQFLVASARASSSSRPGSNNVLSAWPNVSPVYCDNNSRLNLLNSQRFKEYYIKCTIQWHGNARSFSHRHDFILVFRSMCTSDVYCTCTARLMNWPASTASRVKSMTTFAKVAHCSRASVVITDGGRFVHRL